ncbi:Os12g0621201 [Oryza sativa Japonica Group]|uniref:Os12g0621201 protein n=2 Tax=Oryza TaxID=4527 RepID=Q2QM16_ORYSJ|nr:hypothetical protein LOC_Os12g42620 [Oryza sativa Japonica Group]BAT18138.1 Os12g0621201 [Oryza sativa Japonica Group]
MADPPRTRPPPPPPPEAAPAFQGHWFCAPASLLRMGASDPPRGHWIRALAPLVPEAAISARKWRKEEERKVEEEKKSEMERK